MFARLLVRTARAAPLVACGTASHCWFGRPSREELERQAEEQRKAEAAASLRAKLGPLASFDLNGDGKVDQEDVLLAMQLAKNVDSDAVLQSIGDQASSLLATGVPSKVSWGFCSGYCAGYAAKKVGKIMAVGVGGLFVLLQTLAYQGYIVVDQEKIQRDFNEAFDVNRDGNIDTADFQVMYDKLYEVLNYNMPSGGGFAAGLLLGLRSG